MKSAIVVWISSTLGWPPELVFVLLVIACIMGALFALLTVSITIALIFDEIKTAFKNATWLGKIFIAIPALIVGSILFALYAFYAIAGVVAVIIFANSVRDWAMKGAK